MICSPCQSKDLSPLRVQQILQARTKDLSGFAYKLQGGVPYGLDVNAAGTLEVDEKKMSLWIPYADGNNRDGVGDLLDVNGIELSRHRRNPIVLIDHGKHVSLPLGMALERDDKGKYDIYKYTNVIDSALQQAKLNCFVYQGKGIVGVDKSKEYEHALLCQQLFHMAAVGLLRSGSIGYQIIHAKELYPDYETGTPKGLYLQKVLMLEGSLVVLPANQDTVAKYLSTGTCCGKPLVPYLVKSLAPFAPPKKAQMGYEKKSEEAKLKIRSMVMGGNTTYKAELYINGGRSLVWEGHIQDTKAEAKKEGEEYAREWDYQLKGIIPGVEQRRYHNIPPAKWKPGVGAVKDLRKKWGRKDLDVWTYGSKKVVVEDGVVTESDVPTYCPIGQKPNTDFLKRAGWKKKKGPRSEGGPRGELPGRSYEKGGATEATYTSINVADKTDSSSLMEKRKSQIPGDMGFWTEEQQEAEHQKKIKALRTKYKRQLEKDLLPGGLGDQTKPADVDLSQLEEGIRVEMEHTNDHRIAQEIALDHLTEDPAYYSKLRKVEGKGLGFERYYVQQERQMYWVVDVMKSGHSGSAIGPFSARLDAEKRCQELNAAEEVKEKSKKKGLEVRAKGRLDTIYGYYDFLRGKIATFVMQAGHRGLTERDLVRAVGQTEYGTTTMQDIADALYRMYGSREVDYDDQGRVIPFQRKGLEAPKPRGSTPYSSNVSDFQVGDTVVARSYLSWVNPNTGKTENFARTGDRLKVVGTNEIGRCQCRRANGDVASFGSAEIRKSKSLPHQESKDLIEARKKYRTAKGLRRKLRKSSPGISTLRVNEKDLEQCKELAESRGLQFTHQGNGKVKLVGDDANIDFVAKTFGIRG